MLILFSVYDDKQQEKNEVMEEEIMIPTIETNINDVSLSNILKTITRVGDKKAW